ncbi:hypothetical protein ACFFVB_18480 [Formosa undariae]|uniref:Flagellar protein FlaG n=1 Tax=Formosa undariae TaxID=1325436 RepID=A0ABV5F6I1_9FLAO
MSTNAKAKAPQTETKPKEVLKKVEKSNTEVKDLFNPTAESRIKRAENFKILADKFKFLNDKNDDLQKFIVSSDGTKEKIVLENAQGFKFEVSNSNVIEKVLDVVKSELQNITNEAEKEVLTFQI